MVLRALFGPPPSLLVHRQKVCAILQPPAVTLGTASWTSELCPRPAHRSRVHPKMQGNCIKLGQTHVRLPESGRGAPCGRPPPGIANRVGAPLVGALPRA